MKGLSAIFNFRAAARGWLADVLVTLCGVLLIASVLGIRFLNSENWPTGGDTASHLLYAKLYSDELLFSGKLLPWMPEVFCGFPFLSYYFPLPFVVIALLSKVIGFAPAFKWGAFLAIMLLPGTTFICSRRWLGFSWPAALFAALGTLGYLLHEQNSIWGGNLLSTLAGEFSYSYGMFFAVLSMMAWVRAIHHRGRGWLLAALLEAASCFSHGFPLLLLGFSTAFLLLDNFMTGTRQEKIARFKTSLRYLLGGHLLAFALAGGWLWPMLEMHSLTIPNDASYAVSSWRELFPAPLWPVASVGLLGLLLLVFPSVRQGWGKLQSLALCYFVSAAGLGVVFFLIGDQIGLADIRFFPPVWLLGAIACGWLFGQALHSLAREKMEEAWFRFAPRVLIALATCLGMASVLSAHIKMAPDWGFWNHSGLQAKPQWHNLSSLFPVMQGDLWSPRLVFEHDPANNDLGSTRTLEALPMFIGQRPVAEGLYMESATMGPAIYYLQSEVSDRPSSPLVRFPSGSLDPQLAARHMNFLHVNDVLLRSEKAKNAIEASGLFHKMADSSPFAIYRVKQFDSQLAQVVQTPIRIRPRKDWMQDAYAWFSVRSRFDAYLPVYNDKPSPELTAAATHPPAQKFPPVVEKSLDRHQLVFETEAIGKPHLIKMSTHPRWQLASKGELMVAGPGFMLVIPQEKEIRLVFGHTLIGKLGILASTGALLLSVFLMLRRRPTPTQADASAEKWGWRYFTPIIAGWLLLALTGFHFAMRSPDRAYKLAWEHLRAERLQEALKPLEQAYTLRRPPAKKEEALFWLAKTHERVGNRTEAKARYRELIDHFHGFWLPESLYTYIELERQDGRGKEVEPLIRRLREEYPNNRWTQRLDQPQ